jgi:hypothetical protein
MGVVTSALALLTVAPRVWLPASGQVAVGSPSAASRSAHDDGPPPPGTAWGPWLARLGRTGGGACRGTM